MLHEDMTVAQDLKPRRQLSDILCKSRGLDVRLNYFLSSIGGISECFPGHQKLQGARALGYRQLGRDKPIHSCLNVINSSVGDFCCLCTCFGVIRLELVARVDESFDKRDDVAGVCGGEINLGLFVCHSDSVIQGKLIFSYRIKESAMHSA